MMLRLTILLVVFLARTLPAGAAAKPPSTPEEVFGLTKVWNMHLTVPAANWDKMQPARGGFNRPKANAPELNDDRKLRGGFAFDFEYVKGTLEINGHVLRDVGVRFKGNSTYLIASQHLKRPFKIDLDRHIEGQSWGGLRKLTLNNNVTDATATREPLAFALYREAGVPAPRTTYALLTLTVPGKYDRVVVGLYSLIETVDKTYLKDRFKFSKGLLVKPERVGPLDYLGESWANYESRYRPKTTVGKSEQQRLISLARLIHQGSDAEFKARIASYLDMDQFLRYVAATVVLSSMDSFVGLGHNYYLYLDPKKDRFVLIPWDADHAFGALQLIGTARDLMDLSIRQPYPGRNRLVERVLADPKHFEQYRKYLGQLLDRVFTPAWVKENAEVIKKTITPYREKEKKAIADRGESWNNWMLLGMFNPPPKVEQFATQRVASIRGQLDGTRQGTVLRSNFGQPPRGAERALVRPILQQIDRDKNGSLTREEILDGVKQLFRACDPERVGEVDQKALTVALEQMIPRPQAARGAPPGFGPPTMAIPLARGIFLLAQREGRVTEESLVQATDKLFRQTDSNKDGKLDQRELATALRQVVTPPEIDRTKKAG